VELLLNLAWLLVTVFCSIGLLRRARKNPDAGQLWVVMTAVICIMILLFPVISMTDDLHAELFTAEESGKRWVAAIHVQQLVAFVHLLAAWLLLSIAAAQRTSSLSTEDDIVPRPLDETCAAWFTRPPPSLSLT
jgi:hypothetical protein